MINNQTTCTQSSPKKYAGLRVGEHVICNGYPGTVTRLCEFSDSMIEVRVPGGVVCVDAGEVGPEQPALLLDEQAALLRECRLALDDLIAKRPMNAAMVCGSTSLGNLRASLYNYRPQGVFGGSTAVQTYRPLVRAGAD